MILEIKRNPRMGQGGKRNHFLDLPGFFPLRNELWNEETEEYIDESTAGRSFGLLEE